MKTVFLGFFLCFVAAFASAETLMVNSPGDGYLNLRESPNSNAPIVSEMYHGQGAEVLARSGNWLKVRAESGAIGWAYGKHLKPFSSSQNYLRVNSPNDGFLNLRSGPSSEHQTTQKMLHGSKAWVIGRSGDWLNVQHENGNTG